MRSSTRRTAGAAVRNSRTWFKHRTRFGTQTRVRSSIRRTCRRCSSKLANLVQAPNQVRYTHANAKLDQADGRRCSSKLANLVQAPNQVRYTDANAKLDQ